jgi:hypothetical protein
MEEHKERLGKSALIPIAISIGVVPLRVKGCDVDAAIEMFSAWNYSSLSGGNETDNEVPTLTEFSSLT